MNKKDQDASGETKKKNSLRSEEYAKVNDAINNNAPESALDQLVSFHPVLWEDPDTCTKEHEMQCLILYNMISHIYSYLSTTLQNVK